MQWIATLNKGWLLLHHPELWSLDLLLRGLVNPIGFTCLCLVFFPIVGWISGVRPGQHTNRNFFHDLCYWAFYQSGMFDAIFTVAAFTLLEPYMKRINLLGNWPIGPRFVVYWVIADFMQYWVHRVRHSNRFTWAFHTTHHAEERLSFASQAHVHPIDEFISAILLYFPDVSLGADPLTLLPISLLNKVALAAQHAELPWRFGPLYYIFVTPAFHSFHHSTDPKHYNKNYSVVLSVWDFLFGTAVDEKELPKQFGLPDIKMPTLSSQMFTPLRLIYHWFFKKAPTGVAAGEGSSVASAPWVPGGP